MYKDDELYEINIDKLAYSLENNSNIKVSDYMIPIESRYHLLSLEHDRIHNEINNEINKMINFDFNRYSAEDFKENLAKFWDWVKKMFDKFINWVQVFIKRIIAKIYELTIRFNKKESLYQKFNNKVFTSVDVKIKDRKLNPNIVESMDKWIDRTNKWVETIEIDNKQMSYLLKDMSNVFKDMAEIIDNNNDTKSVNKYIDKIFYLDDKKQDTTIRNYFGCNIGETPKAIIILSEKYTKKLIENKKSLEKWLDKLKKFQKYFIDKTKTEEFSDELANDVKKVFSHINYFNNMNYSFFINAVNVRRKVAKYVTIGCLGKKIVEQIEAGVHSGKPFKINTYYGMNFEQWRDVPDESYTIKTEGGATIKVISNSKFHCVFIFVECGKDYNLIRQLEKCRDDFSLITKTKGKIITNGVVPLDIKLMRDHFNLFPIYQKLFQLKIDITKFSTILINGDNEYVVNASGMRNLHTFNEEFKTFKEEYGQCDFSYWICLNNEQYRTNKNDQLFHTSPIDLKNEVSGLGRGAYFYSEPRVYFGANIPMTPDGRIHKEVKDKKIYLIKNIPSNSIIYRDPEYVFKRDYVKEFYHKVNEAFGKSQQDWINESDRTACFVPTEKLLLEDVADMFLNRPEYI